MEIPDEMIDVLRSAIRLLMPILHDNDAAISISDASRQFGICTRTLREEAKSGNIRAFTLGRKIMIYRSSFSEWLEKKATQKKGKENG